MIFHSTTPDVKIPSRTLHDYVFERVHDRVERTAIIDAATGRSLTYGELAAAIHSTAAGLVARGLKKGEVVAIDAPNSPDWIVAYLAVATAGGVVTTISPLFTADELGRQLADAKARFLITVPSLIDKARAGAASSAIEEIFTFGEIDGATPFENLLAGGSPPRLDFDPAEDVVVMPFSSGTTGMPKGVMLTHRNLVANIAQTIAVDDADENDVALGVLPFFHIYGMVCIMGAGLRVGGTIVTVPRFDLENFLDALQTYGVTRVNLVPPIIIALAKHPIVDRYDLSKLQNITSGAAPLGADVQQLCSRRIGCTVRQGYGLTETSPVTHVVPPPPAPQKPGTVGPPLPNTEVMIVDLEGQDLGPDEEGEVWIRGPQVMKGYFDNPEATAAMITPEGWLRTGDVGRADEDGYLTIVDRVKELIKYNAFQVAPAELEAVLLSNPAIADAAVIGSPDEEAGEIPHAFVVRAGELTEQQVIDYVAERVAPYKKVRRVTFRDAIPKSPSGKILRRQLRAQG